MTVLRLASALTKRSSQDGWLSPWAVRSLRWKRTSASVRTPPRDWGTAGASEFVLRVRGDGKRYRFNLRTPDGPSAFRYEAPLETTAGEWKEVAIPIERFESKAFGRRVPLVGAPDPARIRSLGFMISDRQAGPFRLEIDWIAWK